MHSFFVVILSQEASLLQAILSLLKVEVLDATFVLEN